MDIISIFAERLNDMMHDSRLDVKQLSKNVNISETRIYEWLKASTKYMPSTASVIIIADYFRCSIDFLIGREEENYLPNPKSAPPFSTWFRAAIEAKGYKLYSLYQKTQISTGQFYKWINGKREPSLDSLVRIADVLDCSVDYLVGRE